MLLRRFYDTKLAQASYLIGCQETGEGIVIDPNRDVAQYVAAAAAEKVRIRSVTETHIHADYVSGTRELAARTGARVLISGEGGAEWRYDFAGDPDTTELHDGDTIAVGCVRLDVMHTPGHTPEHLTFLITDEAATDRPMGMVTGDFIFAGDVGRPDLLERAAKQAGTMEAGARRLFRSLARVRDMPDYLQIWPGHGAGSACGKSLGAVPSSTLGYERIANWAFLIDDEDTFVREVLAGQPEPPTYFAEMKRVNKHGPRVLGQRPEPPRLAAADLVAAIERGAFVVDARRADDFAAGHIPGTIGIPLGASFPTWAGWFVPYDRDVQLIVAEPAGDRAADAVRDLSMIGLDRVAGYAGPDALAAWSARHGPLETIAHATVDESADQMRRGDVTVVDVRAAAEWDAGHIAGVPNIPLGLIGDRLDEIPTDKPILLHCQGGSRSVIAAGVLQARGVKNVVNMVGGYGAWEKSGRPSGSSDDD
jgi:hydroxyacylglutathione hydrolase